MDTGNIAKAAIVGGIVAIVLEFIVGAAAGPKSAAAFYLGLVILLVGGFIAGWIAKGKPMDGAVAGAVAGLVYVILGLLIIFPAVSTYRVGGAGAAVVAIVVGIVLGAIGGIAGKYVCPTPAKAGKSSRKK